MSQQLTSDQSVPPGEPRSGQAAVAQLNDYRRAKRTDPDLEPLRRQVSTIIDAILADNSPYEAEVRDNLRIHVARHPGRPEKALLGHLISMSDRQDEAG